MTGLSITRRRALAGLLAASPVRAQRPEGEPPGRIAPVDELVNAFEFEAMAERKLDSATYAEIAGSDRRPFDRITFRPRMMVDSTKLDLTTELLGQELFAPILIAPVARQKRFHADGELAMMRGASAAKATMVVAADSSFPVEQIASQKKVPFWYQVYPDAAALEKARLAVKAGCKAVCLTLSSSTWGWNEIDRFREGIGVPLLLKGIMNPDEARLAVDKGAQGFVVSNYVGHAANGLASAIEMLPAIAAAVNGKVPILVDGGFRRGSDVLKALALGARAVMIGRPALWGLAAYGADGVQNVVELLQTELARDMAMCGTVNVKAIGPQAVKIHRW